MHFGYHLRRVEEHQQNVQGEGHVLQRRVVFEGHGRVHADRNDADDGTDAQQRMNPLQRRSRVTTLMPRNILNLCYEPCYLENVNSEMETFHQ